MVSIREADRRDRVSSTRLDPPHQQASLLVNRQDISSAGWLELRQRVVRMRIQWLGRSYSLLFNPQFQSFKLLLGHALQRHRCGQIQSGNVYHFVAACYLTTEFLYFWVSAHFQKHFIRIGDGQSFFNQAMLNQNAMIRRYCQGRWMGLRSALVLFWVFHCTILTRFLNAVISLALKLQEAREEWMRVRRNGN